MRKGLNACILLFMGMFTLSPIIGIAFNISIISHNIFGSHRTEKSQILCASVREVTCLYMQFSSYERLSQSTRVNQENLWNFCFLKGNQLD